MKMVRLVTRLIALLATTLFLYGCQEKPGREVVVSKSNTQDDFYSYEATTETDVTQMGEGNNTHLQYSDRFESTDGTVVFTFNIDVEAGNPQMPIVEVVPHYFTTDDAQRVASVLFPNAIFYEAEPRFSPLYSKSDIQDKLARWMPFAGSKSVDNFIKEYTILMETAPNENPHKLAKWEFTKETFYLENFEIAKKMDTSKDNDEIRLSLKDDEVPFLYDVVTRNRSDFKLNNIYVYPYDGMSPNGIDHQIFMSRLCGEGRPTEAQVANIKQRAQKMLEEMQLGNWLIDEVYVEQSGNEYLIHVNAVPSFGGIAAIRRDQIMNLKSKDNYASNYYITDAMFSFGTTGRLITFDLYSPVDVKQTINESVKTIPINELLQLARKQLSLSDMYQYDYMQLLDGNSENVRCNIEIDKMNFGLTRVKVANSDDSYYYVPAVSFQGSVQFKNVESGTIYDLDTDGNGYTLLTLNAVDGTVINATNQ